MFNPKNMEMKVSLFMRTMVFIMTILSAVIPVMAGSRLVSRPQWVSKVTSSFQHVVLFCLFFWLPFTVYAVDWDTVVNSNNYYYGIGQGNTVDEASKQALSALISMIATNVSSDFTELMEERNENGRITSQERVQMSIKSTSSQSLTNALQIVRGKEPNYQVLRYMERSELDKIFEARTKIARRMKVNAGQYLSKGKLDMALQYYYRSYALIRSLQHPGNVTDDEGNILLEWLPRQIEDILDDIQVTFEQRDGNYVDIVFSYDNKPVQKLYFNYFNGQEREQGCAQGGRGSLCMKGDMDDDFLMIDIEYEFKDHARSQEELQSVYEAVPPHKFRQAEKRIMLRRPKPHPGEMPPPPPPPFERQRPTEKAQEIAAMVPETQNVQPRQSQLAADTLAQAAVVSKVLDAIRKRRQSDVMEYFTPEGLERFEGLISYGKGRIVGTPQFQFYRGADGNTVVRGLQMSFYFDRGTTKSCVEDVILTLNKDNLISNVAFGLGKTAENDILCREAPGWTDQTREQVMEFMENYKTAYCMRDLDYIRSIFADDAVIIVGNIVRTRSKARTGDDMTISLGGQQKIVENRYTKEEYLKRLERCFRNNEFINLRFSKNDARWLRKCKEKNGKDIFAIEIAQEYNSTTYADEGYLFLLVDMTEPDTPQIKIRTWQPSQTPIEQLYNEGDFYSE